MDDRESTFGASIKGLQGLLGVGVGKDVPQDAASVDRTAGEILRARLEEALPVDAAAMNAPPNLTDKLQVRQPLLPDQPLGEVLLDANTDLDTIESVKDYGKKLASGRDSQADHSAAVAIYFAAIASALLFYGEKITSYSYEHLREAFEELTEDAWIPAELARHFSKACSMCRDLQE